MTPEQVQRAIGHVLSQSGQQGVDVTAVQIVMCGPYQIEVKVRAGDDWYQNVLPLDGDWAGE